jgi:hypothetical protein
MRLSAADPGEGYYAARGFMNSDTDFVSVTPIRSQVNSLANPMQDSRSAAVAGVARYSTIAPLIAA